MEKPVVGQVLFSLNVGNAARNRQQVLTPVEVIKVGRKYFTTMPVGGDLDRRWNHTQYHIDGWSEKSDYSKNSRLYATEIEWEEEKEAGDIRDRLRDLFTWNTRKSVGIDKLRRIAAILDE
jgi:hypothetical protein